VAPDGGLVVYDWESAEPAGLPIGTHDRGAFTAVVIETAGKNVQGARLEYHERDIDIHATLQGHDIIGWQPRALCTTPDGGFDRANDIGFVRDQPTLWVVTHQLTVAKTKGITRCA
jgi:beta-galactosidase beta subunit